MIAIYCYVHRESGKIYIGQTDNLIKRHREHKCGNSSMYIDRAIKAHGIDKFALWTIKLVNTQEEADQEEIYWIARMREYLGRTMVYNIADGGAGGLGKANKGRKHSVVTKAKLSAMRKGKKKSREHKDKIAQAHMGYKFSDEARKKMSEAAKRRCQRAV